MKMAGSCSRSDRDLWKGKMGRSGRIASEYGRVGRRLSEKDTVEACAVDSRWRRMNNAVLRMLTSSSILQPIFQ